MEVRVIQIPYSVGVTKAKVKGTKNRFVKILNPFITNDNKIFFLMATLLLCPLLRIFLNGSIVFLNEFKLIEF